MQQYDDLPHLPLFYVVKCVTNIICFPYAGVAQVLNKEDGFQFDENDEQLFEVRIKFINDEDYRQSKCDLLERFYRCMNFKYIAFFSVLLLVHGMDLLHILLWLLFVPKLLRSMLRSLDNKVARAVFLQTTRAGFGSHAWLHFLS